MNKSSRTSGSSRRRSRESRNPSQSSSSSDEDVVFHRPEDIRIVVGTRRKTRGTRHVSAAFTVASSTRTRFTARRRCVRRNLPPGINSAATSLRLNAADTAVKEEKGEEADNEGPSDYRGSLLAGKKPVFNAERGGGSEVPSPLFRYDEIPPGALPAIAASQQPPVIQRRCHLAKMATKIESLWRGYSQRKQQMAARLQDKSAATIIIQSWYRGVVQKRKFKLLKKATKSIQTLFRALAAKKLHLQKMATKLESLWRGYSQRKRYAKMLEATIALQSAFLTHKSKTESKSKRDEFLEEILKREDEDKEEEDRGTWSSADASSPCFSRADQSELGSMLESKPLPPPLRGNENKNEPSSRSDVEERTGCPFSALCQAFRTQSPAWMKQLLVMLLMKAKSSSAWTRTKSFIERVKLFLRLFRRIITNPPR